MPIPSKQRREPVQRTLLRDTVFQRLRDAILDGTLKPGERLNDDEIEAWLGVSRTPIRDAFNELSRAGLVEMAPNRYTRVAVPQETEAAAALQTLGVIMGGVTRLAVPRLSGADRAAIATQIQKVVGNLNSDEGHETNEAAVKLWHLIMRRCGNPLLLAVCEQTIDGLAFKLRIATVDRLFDFSEHSELFAELGRTIQADDALGAERVIHQLHFLPAP